MDIADLIELRPVEDPDVAVFFSHQLDADACRMAAFVGEPDKAAFVAKWTRIRADPTADPRTVLVGGEVAGFVAAFEREGRREVAFWLGREFWGRGIATGALHLFLMLSRERPLCARVAWDNAGSRRVLEKCGFRVRERQRCFAPSRGEEIEELILGLD